MEYEKQEPFGEYRADIRSALLALHICASFGAKNKDNSPLRLEQFLLKFDDGEEIAGSRDAALEDKARGLAAMFGSVLQGSTHPGVPPSLR